MAHEKTAVENRDGHLTPDSPTHQRLVIKTRRNRSQCSKKVVQTRTRNMNGPRAFKHPHQSSH
ncbi:hypothetical protein E2C01_093412 [Portunus trituberculatus]|uniref:Uncharacterized protein n=1 Tax=Portunus trituberculatus TaxID=210409 RepID=A0A5B7JPR2_PORTR|nr:hypothetical protein [Portunus trituberculatus]